MGAEAHNELVVKFGADIAELQKGIAQVNSLLAAKVQKGFEDAGKGATISGGKIRAAFRDASQAVAFLGVALGIQKAEFIVFAATAISSVGAVGKALAAVAGGPIAVVITILGALGVAIYAASNNWEQFKLIVAKVWAYIKEAVGKAGEFIFRVLAKIPFLSDDVVASFKEIEQAAREMSQASAKEITAVSAAQARLEAAKKKKEDIKKATEEYGAALAKISPKQDTFAEKTEAARAKISALETYLGALMTAGLNPAGDQVEFFSRKLAEAKAELEDLKVPTEAERKELEKFSSVELFKATEGNSLGLADKLLPESVIATLSDRQIAIRKGFITWFEDLKLTTEDLLVGFQDVFNGFAQSFGDAVAQVIVYGENFKSALTAVFKSLAASIISTLVKLLVEYALYLIARLLGLKTEATTTVATKAGETYAIAYESAVANLPFPVNLIAAPGIAAASAAGLIAGAKGAYGAGLGFGAAAHGALVSGPALMLVGEGRERKEVIAPYSKFEDALAGGGGVQNIYIKIGEEVIARTSVRGHPRELRIAGVL